MSLTLRKSTHFAVRLTWRSLSVCLLLTAFSVVIRPTLAQMPTAQAVPASVSTMHASAPATRSANVTKIQNNGVNTLIPAGFSSLDWNSLTVAQKTALSPLTANWANLSDAQKRKWISLSTNFPQMSALEQAKLHARMAQWAALSAKQREQARLNFAELKKVAPEQKTEKWEAYQALSVKEKQELAKSAQPKPPRTALAASPAASDKLNRLPIQKNSAGVSLPLSQSTLSKNTLLVKPKPPVLPTAPKAPASGMAHDTN